MASKLAIGFLGTGKMATALARGFIRAGLVKSNQVAGSDPSAPARQAFANETGAKALASNGEVVACSTVLVLAVKPDHAAEVLTQVRPGFTANHLLISIVAGVTLGRLEAGLGAGARVIRVMPNTPALLGASASAYASAKPPGLRMTSSPKNYYPPSACPFGSRNPCSMPSPA